MGLVCRMSHQTSRRQPNITMLQGILNESDHSQQHSRVMPGGSDRAGVGHSGAVLTLGAC